MVSTNVRLPDGSETPSSSVICEGCGSSMDNHACGGAAPAPTIVTSRSTGKRKDPHERPLCPHCGGAVHFSMPGSLQNMECILRQYGVSTGAMSDPFQRIPLLPAITLAAAAEWAAKEGKTYGRMESAAGGSGTYTSLRPKVAPEDRKPRARKAGKGEKIEDMAAAVVPEESPIELAETVIEETITEEAPLTDEQIAAQAEAARAARRAARLGKMASVR